MKEQDVPKALAETFKRLGGIAEFAKWARTHKTIFYSHYVKMIPLSVTASVDTTVNVNIVREQAQQKLQSAFQALIDARRDDERATIEARREADADTTYSRIVDDATRDAPPAPQDDPPSSTADDQSIKNENRNPESEGSPLARGPRRSTTVRARPVSVEPTTTQLFFESNGGGGRKFWGPVGEGGGMP